MAMLKKLKSLFIVEVEGSFAQEAKEVKGTKSTGIKTNSKSNVVPKIPVDGSVDAPSKFINSLLEAIEKNNMEGFDYLEYKQSLKSLSKMEMDENTMFSSAFAMAKTMGASKKNLVDSAKFYVSILNEEKSKFVVAYEKQQEKQVTSREQRLNTITASIKKKEEQIMKLQSEIKELKKEFDLKKNEINSAAAKVALTRDQFFAAHKKVIDQINSDIDRMNKYLTT